MSEPRRRILIPGDRKQAAPSAAGDASLPVEACDCPRLDPADWDGVESDWSDITFLRASVKALAGVPVGFDAARSALFERASALGFEVPEDAMLLIGEGTFSRPLLLEVEGEVPASKEVIRPGGVAYSRLVEAPWGELAKAARRLRDEARERYGRPPAAMYAWYLTCPVCSRERNFETLLVAHYPG
ncbi:hydrolase [Tepidiforma sp.]|jgi:hypothetical protein|uniref:hydrolase n=1 Tax=Tepidiforma sp. TaxID=2682230 RepID=UPI0021DCCF95|nr:hydrolase [Tepidiforma sp.]MCX7617390.1 hypothetical protein [Tepidiforma sp.]GIW17399.1 MAG: hypothetical protein KatS3mg064_0556 [Tepidiforma sp.]